jgi:hypothetical protein
MTRYLDTNDLHKSGALSRDPLDGATPVPAAIIDANLESEPWPEKARAEAFHGLAGEFVQVLEPHTESDPHALLFQFVVAAGSAFGRAPHALVQRTRHGTNEYLLLVGATSKARKGTAWNDTRDCVARVDPEWARNRVTHGLSSGEGLIWAVRDPISKSEKDKGTSTVQSVVVDPGVIDKRLLVVEPEFASVLRRMGRDSNSLSAIIRCAWDSGDLNTMVKNSPARATDAHVSIIAHTTSDELLRELDRTETANGFANRFMFACVRRARLLPDGGAAPADEMRRIEGALFAAVEHARACGQLQRDAAASELWHAQYGKLAGDRPGLVGAIVARAEAHVLRLSVICALLDRAREVRIEHLRAALAMWDYCERSALHVFGESLGDSLADETLRILRGYPDGLTRTTLHQLFGRHERGSRLSDALRALAGKGLVECEFEQTGGRRAERWRAK